MWNCSYVCAILYNAIGSPLSGSVWRTGFILIRCKASYRSKNVSIGRVTPIESSRVFILEGVSICQNKKSG